MRNSKLSFMEKKLGNCCVKVGSGITPKGGSKVYTQEGIPFIRSQNVYPGGLHLDDIVYISLKQNQIMASTQLKPLDVLLNITGASIGRCCVVPQNFRKGNVNQHVCIIRCDDLLDPYYLCYFLNSSTGQKQINSFQAGGNRQGLNYEQIKKIIIPYLSMKEQKRITEILSIWDLAIEILSKLINAKTNLKKGLMRKLLTGKVRFKRFKNEWEHLKLSDACEIHYGRSQKGLPPGKYKIYGTGGVIGSTSVCLYNKPSVLIGRKGTIDAPIYVDEPFYPIDTIFYVQLKKGVLPKFFYYQLSMIDLKRYNEASGVPSLNRETLYRIGINMTSEEEQKDISAILSAVNHELDCLIGIQEKLKSQKKGLMQKLLTGKIRVKT